MTTAQVTLTETENRAIQALSESAGKSQDEILHEAIAQFLERHQAERRLHCLRQARGLWRDRQDLPDATELRREWDRI